MVCYSPLVAYYSSDKKISFSYRDGYIDKKISLPCNNCIGCRLSRSKSWAMRCMHESTFHQHNMFLTLTYDDEHIPVDCSLSIDEHQRFMKRLRKYFSFRGNKIKFYMCGEYGEKFRRPHYHYLIFGAEFDDKVLLSNKSKNKIYVSDTLQKLWGKGFCTIGSVTYESAGYVARYVLKKITGDMAYEHYYNYDLITGEAKAILPEFNKMSLKTAIGFEFYQKYKNEIFPADEVPLKGKLIKPPKYYLKRYQIDDNEKYKQVLLKRAKEALKSKISSDYLDSMYRRKQKEIERLIRSVD